MAKLALIRLAGMMAAMATCAAAATEAAAQDSIVLNNQLQLGDVVAGQTLNVVDASQTVSVSNAAQGNTLSGAVQDVSIGLDSTQDMRGNATATTSLALRGDTEGYVSSATQANGNALSAAAYDGDIMLDATQTVDAGEIAARTTITNADARLLDGANVSAAAAANAIALGGTGTSITGTVDQSSDAGVTASNFAATGYIPARADFASQAAANVVTASSDLASNQAIDVRQRSTGDRVVSTTSANAANAWDLAGRAQAVANQAVFANQGGSLITRTNQANESEVRAATVVTAYDFGAANAYARGAGNEVSIGNNDIYVEVDNTQLNTGGVDVSASFEGTNGYDAYVGADAVGNSVTAYACAECAGFIDATNNQTNTASVSAMSNTVVNGQGRSVITGSNAVGNAATFYVSRQNGH